MRTYGTLAISELVSCHAGVAFAFVTDPAKASQPIPRASFDCAHAQTPLEHTVCTNPQLGHFDLLMANAYKTLLGELKGSDKASLMQYQRAWNAVTPVICLLSNAPASSAVLTCLRNRYRQRAQDLADCAVSADVTCIKMSDSQNPHLN